MIEKKPLNQGQRDICARAGESISKCESLLKRPEFTEFMDRFKARADALALQILHDEMPPEKREELRHIRIGILEVLAYPTEQISASRKILRDYGQDAGG
jgi:hypothetical protein